MSQALHLRYLASRPGDMDSNDEDKISGHSIVEQATTLSFTEMKEGVAPMPSTS